ncbi:MAG: hypothetical protein WCG29_11840 [Desulfomonile sp.]
MLRIILREVVLLVVCLSVVPVAVIILLSQGNSLHAAANFLTRHILSGGTMLGETSVGLWLKFFSPYLFVQSIRAYLWSQRSLSGRRWSNLYFFLLLAVTGGWSARNAWDLFYLMFALGDIPAELMQFFELEGTDILIAVASVLLAINCLRIFINPARNRYAGSKKGTTIS